MKQSSELIKTHTPVNDRPSQTGPGSAGQSGDLQGLQDIAGADSESVVELLEEGQYSEAEAVRAVENAQNAEGRELRPKEFPEDDVPLEYLDSPDGPDKR